MAIALSVKPGRRSEKCFVGDVFVVVEKMMMGGN
jgi:hypothetical protein